MTALPTLPAPDAPDILEKSNETMEWLRANIKVGYTTERGPAWWANAVTKAGQWEIPDGSHFEGPVPIEAVRELLDVQFVKGTVHVTYTDTDGNVQVSGDEKVQPVVNASTGKIFSFPKEGYKIHPYLETLHGFIQAIQYDQAVAVGSVGLLKEGGQAFLQAVLPETIEVEGYGYQPYMLAATSVDLSRATSYTTGALGAVCDNTVRNALKEALTALKIRHSRFSGVAVQAAREKLGLRLQAVGEEFGEMITELTKVDVSDKDFRLWLDEIQPRVKPDPESSTGGPRYTNAEAKRAEYTRLWKKDEKVAPWSGTAFGILQLDNTYRTWEGKVTGAGGRIEQNYRRLVRGDTAAADVDALATLAKVQKRTLTVV